MIKNKKLSTREYAIKNNVMDIYDGTKYWGKSTLLRQKKEWLIDEIECCYHNLKIKYQETSHYAYMFNLALPYLTDEQFDEILNKAQERIRREINETN